MEAGRPAPTAAAHAAPPQPAPDNNGGNGWDWVRTLVARGQQPLQAKHLRRKPARMHPRRMHCVLLDCSASMLTGQHLAHAKGFLLQLLQHAYHQRDHVALLCFAGQHVQLRLPPQRPPAWNEHWVAPIAGGGGTPLAHAVAQANQLLRTRCRHAIADRWLWLLSDGRTREQPARPSECGPIWLVDFENARVPLHRMQTLAQLWQAGYLHAQQLLQQPP